MKAVWLKGHTKSTETKEARRAEVLAYRNAFDALREVLNKEFRKKENVRDYDTPNWEYKQIANNEYNAALDDLLKLIDLNLKD
jgi:hypothetical protein